MVLLGIFPWIIFLIFLKILNEKIPKNLLFASLFYFAAVLIYSYKEPRISLLFVIIYLFSIHIYFLRGNIKHIIFSTFWFFMLDILYFLESKEAKFDIIIPIAITTLSLRQYSSKIDFLIFNIFSMSLIISYYYNFYLFFTLLSVYSFYFLFLSLLEYKLKLEKESSEYKRLLDRAVNTEVQKKLLQVDDNIAISSKKLKEIFKLSNYTVSTTDLEAMAERVVKGLLDLGYTGVIISIFPRKIFKKLGFFPNYKLIVENITTEKLNKVNINEEDKYIIIPLKVSNEKLGFLAVYKKEGVSAKETEYLITYANSVATAVANIVHFEDLIKLEELTYKTFESLDIGIAVLDENFNIKTSNKRFKEMSDLESNNLFQSIPELRHLEKDFKEVIEKNKAFETILSSINKQGFIYRIKALPLYTQSSPDESIDTPKIVLIIEDITEKEKLEAQIIETEKLAVIGKMAAALAHEIKNPLTAISASAYRIKSKAKKLNDNKIIEFSEKIETHSERARNIIDRVLNYSKPSYHKLEVINIKDILRQTLEFIEHSLKGKKIKIKTNLRKNAFVNGDKNALQQVFINILMNAIEALEHIENGVIEIDLDKNEEYVIVSIKDNGIGIPDKVKDKIFEPFFSTKDKGTGLGLSVVDRIIKDHGGEIYVDNKNGTTFTIKLPITEE